MATRGRIKGWRPADVVAKMSPSEREAYEKMIAEEKAKRELEKAQNVKDREAKKEEAKALKKAKREAKKTDKPVQGGMVNKDWAKPNESSGDVQETVIHHVSREGFCIVETNELYWKNKINRWMAKYPDKVIVFRQSGDMIAVKIPYNFMKKVNVTNARTVTDAQKEHMSMLGKSRKNQNEDVENEDADSFEDEDILEEEIQEEDKEEVIYIDNDGNIVSYEDDNIDTQEDKEVETKEEETTEITEEDETDEEFEGTPMNRYRDYEEEEKGVENESEEKEPVPEEKLTEEMLTEDKDILENSTSDDASDSDECKASESDSDKGSVSTSPQNFAIFKPSHKGCTIQIDEDKIKEVLRRRGK